MDYSYILYVPLPLPLFLSVLTRLLVVVVTSVSAIVAWTLGYMFRLKRTQRFVITNKSLDFGAEPLLCF